MDHLHAVNTLATERYLLGEMTELERYAFEEHYFDCSACAEDVRLGAIVRDGARAGLLGTPNIAQFERHPRGRRAWRYSVTLPWAVAAMFALAVGYQSLSVNSGGTRFIEPVPLVPVTLRPASRGQESVVTMSRSDAAVTLAIDLGTVNPSGELELEMRRADGSAIASRQISAPQPGSPLLLWVPSSLLKSSEHYIVTVRPSVGSGLTASDYRFTVVAR